MPEAESCIVYMLDIPFLTNSFQRQKKEQAEERNEEIMVQLAKHSVSIVSTPCCISLGWRRRMKQRNWDTDVTHKWGVHYSFCTFGDLEADHLGHMFITIPFCTSVYSEAEILHYPCQLCIAELQQCERRKSGLFLLYKMVLHFCVKSVEDIASRFFRIL